MARFDTLRRHPNFSQDDAIYLIAKGWTLQEIKTRWDEEARDQKTACRWDEPQARAKLIDTINAFA